MAEWDDIEIEAPDEVGPKRRIRWPVWAGIAALAFLVGFLWFFVFKGSEPPPEPTRMAEPAAEPVMPELPPPPPEPEEAVDLPVLEESDGLVRKLVGTLTSHVELAHWLANKDLIRTFVVAVDNIAEGLSPAKHLPFLKPSEAFKAVYDSGAFYVDPKSCERYTLVTEVFTSINTRSAARTYRTLKPLIQEAYVEMGYPDRDFDQKLAKAIDHLLLTPVPDGYVELDGETVAYKYIDPKLENLTPAQKQFLRMGPRNARKVQRKLTELKGALYLAGEDR